MTEQGAIALPSVESRVFGVLSDGTEIREYTLRNSRGMVLKVINYGAVITECLVPDLHGETVNVCLGFDNLESYVAKHPRFGSTIGRYANRISNAQFKLDGKTYKLAANKGTSTIHGGNVGFDKKVWKVEDTGHTPANAWIEMSYLSPDMEEGFPGNLKVEITFALDESNSVFIKYRAKSDKPTPVNLTNHSYFNLAGAGNGNVLSHVVSFNSNLYTPLNDSLVPTGEIAPVDNTPFDFRRLTKIGARIEKAGGYDLNYIINGSPGVIGSAGAVIDPDSGRVLSVYTDQPAFQFFTANSFDGSIVGKGGAYNAYAGFCIETQHYPDSVNQPSFPNTILRPEEEFSSVTQYAFSNMPHGWIFFE